MRKLILPMTCGILITVHLPAEGQTLSNTGAIERPVVETIRIHSTVSAPARVILPPPLVPVVDATASFRRNGAAAARDIRRIRGRYLGSRRHEPTRRAGLESLAPYTDPEVVPVMIEVLLDEEEDVQNWLLDHLASRVRGGIGQAALAHLAIYAKEEDLRGRALERLSGPANDHTRFIIDLAIRSDHPEVIERVAKAARALSMVEVIGDLILADAGVSMHTRRRGDLAVARVGDELVYVSDYLVDEQSRLGLEEQLGPLPVLEDGEPAPDDEDYRRLGMPAPPDPLHEVIVFLATQASGSTIDFDHRFREWRTWYHENVLEVNGG